MSHIFTTNIDIPDFIEAGKQSVLIDFNTAGVGLTQASFLITGIDYGMPVLYASDSLTDPDAPRDTPYNDNTVARRFFRLEFNFPDPPPIGILNIALKEDEIELAEPIPDPNTDYIEWGWFPPIDVFVDSSGNFAGTVASDLEENLVNPSGAEVTLSVVSHTAAIASATISDGDLAITVSGATANVSGTVVIKAAATIDNVLRETTQEIVLRVVVAAVDLDGYATEDYVSGFVTRATTNYLATRDYVGTATDGLVTAGVTDGLATEVWVNTKGYVTAGVTDGLITRGVTNLANYITTAAITTYVQGATSGLASDADLTAATQGLITRGVTNLANYVTSMGITTYVQGATSGLATDAELTAATQGFITAGFVTNATTNYLATRAWVEAKGYVTAGATQGLITRGITNLLNYVTTTAITTYVQGATSGLATDAELTAATQGFITAGFVTNATTNYLATRAWVEAKGYVTAGATQGLITRGITNLLNYVTTTAITTYVQGATSGLATDAELTAATSGLATDADLTAATSGLATDAELTAATQGLVTAGVTDGLQAEPPQGAFITDGAITDYVTTATDGLQEAPDDGSFITDGAITDYVTTATDGLQEAPDDGSFITDGAITDYVTEFVEGAVEDFLTGGAITDYVTDYVSTAVSEFITEGATDGLLDTESLDESLETFAEDELFDYVVTYFSENTSKFVTVSADNDKKKIQLDFQTTFSDSVSELQSDIDALMKAVTALQDAGS